MSTCTVMYCWCFDHKINGTNWGVVVVLIMSHSKFKTKDIIFDPRIMALIFSSCIACSTLPEGNAQRGSEVSEGDITDRTQSQKTL